MKEKSKIRAVPGFPGPETTPAPPEHPKKVNQKVVCPIGLDPSRPASECTCQPVYDVASLYPERWECDCAENGCPLCHPLQSYYPPECPTCEGGGCGDCA